MNSISYYIEYNFLYGLMVTIDCGIHLAFQSQYNFHSDTTQTNKRTTLSPKLIRIFATDFCVGPNGLFYCLKLDTRFFRHKNPALNAICWRLDPNRR